MPQVTVSGRPSEPGSQTSAMTAAPGVTIPKAGTIPQTPQTTRSLSAHVRSGAIWNMGTTIFLRLSGIGVTAIVARILSPHDFGVFAVATTVFTIVWALGEFGVTSCLVRADLSVDALAPTLWSVSLISSLAMAGVLVKFAGPIAASLGSADAARPVQVMAIVVVIQGIAAVPTAQCTREFRQEKLFLANALSFLPSMAVLVFLARHGSGAMAFAWSRVTGQSIALAVILLSAPKLHLPRMTRYALGILYRFGLPLAVANFVGYILQNVDYALIGHFLGPVLLGTYVLAFNAASWSTTLLGGVLNTVSMPAFSRVKHDAVKLEGVMADALRSVVLFAAPMCTLVMVLAHPLVLTVYGGHWVAAATVLSILSCYGLISIVGVLFASMLAALGRSKLVLAVQLIWLAGLLPAMAIGVHEDGIVGAAIAHIVIIGPIVLPCYLFALKRAIGIRAGLLARAAFAPFAAAVAAAGLAWFTASEFDRPAVQLVAGLAAGGLLYVAVTAPQLILLVMRGKAMNPQLMGVLRTYYRIGRALGIRMGPPPRHAGAHQALSLARWGARGARGARGAGR
jgi:lipopolysaccharide exporter